MFTKTFWKYGFCLHCGLVLLVALSAYLGVIPTVYRGIPHADLIGHFVLFGILAFFFDGLLQFRPLLPGKIAFLRLAPVLLLTVIAIEELAQSLSPRRTASVDDFIADVIGVFICSWLAKFLTERYEHSTSRS